MSEEQEELINAPPPLWVNEFGHLLGFGDGNWSTNNGQYQKIPAIYATTEFYPCTEVIGRWITNKNGGEGKYKTINLRPYKYAGHPGWGWLLRDVGTIWWNAFETGDYYSNPKICSTDRSDGHSHSSTYGYGLISEEGELLHLGDEFTNAASYDGYMMLLQTPYDCIRGQFLSDKGFYFMCLTNAKYSYATMKKGYWGGN